MTIKNNNKILAYVENVCSHIKNKEVHEEIKLELTDHLETLKEQFISTGATSDDAIDQAIAQMGDISLVGKQLNAAHKTKLDLKIFIPIIIFSLIGLILLASIQANNTLTPQLNLNMVQKSFIYYLIGITLMIGLSFFDYKKLLPHSYAIYVTTLAGMLLTTLFGTYVNGVPFLKIGPLAIDFITISPYLLLISLAGMFQKWNWSSTKSLIKGYFILVIPCLFFVMTQSLSPLILYVSACLILMILLKIKLRYILLFPTTVLTFIYFFIISFPTKGKNILTILFPMHYNNEANSLFTNLQQMTKTAGFIGKNMSSEKLILQEVHTDFIFAYMTYTFGWLAAIAILILILYFILRLVKLSSSVKNSYGKFLSAALVTLLSTQFILSILINLGMFPLLRVSLPFISFGGSHLILDMITSGLILSIYRRKNLSPSINLNPLPRVN